jgi:phosphoenolpyruvate carboxykinase (GTP)
MRVLKWIVERVNSQVGAVESPFGLMPRYEDLDLAGLDFSKAQFETITNISRAEALSEIEEIKTFFEKFGAQLPPELEIQRQEFGQRAEKAPEVWSVATAA